MDKKIYFFGGKGGTGKTSLSAAWALKLASEGKKVLAISTDPAHSLADAFNTTLCDSPRELAPNLWGLEIDTKAEVANYLNGIRESMKNLVSPAIVEEINHHLDVSASSPGSEESALFDRFTSLMELAGTEFDCLVFDTAPTGHTLRLLELPELMRHWMSRLQEKRNKAMDLLDLASRYEEDVHYDKTTDPILAVLAKRQAQFAKAREVITDKSITTFFLVTLPEKMPLLETSRALEKLSTLGVPVGPVIINRLLPEESGDYFRHLREKQKEILKRYKDIFATQGTVTVPWLDSDVEGADDLRRIAPHLTMKQ